MKNRALWMTRALASLTAVLCIVPSESVAQAAKATLKELTETSHAIVRGKCEKKESYWNDSHTKIFTSVTIRTIESIKGNPGAETVVTIPGGQVGSTIYEVSDMPSFIEGEEMLVFLWNHPSGKTLVTGALQGKLKVLEENSTGQYVVQGARFLIEGEQMQKPPGLQKTGIERTDEQKVYLDDMKAEIRKYVGK